MSATNFPSCIKQAVLVTATMLTWAFPSASAHAAPDATVTQADIERAQRTQPTITEADIKRAQQRARTPTDQELSRVPIPAAPQIDKLPQPETARVIDLEQLARGYEANTDAIAAAQGFSSGPTLLIFVSFTLPQATLQRLVAQAAKSHAVLMVRGLVNGSLRETVTRVQQLVGDKRVAFQIDPQAFDRFGVNRAPTFVLVRAGAQAQSCASGQCFASDAYVTVTGDVSLDYALERMASGAPRFAREADGFLKKLRG